MRFCRQQRYWIGIPTISFVRRYANESKVEILRCGIKNREAEASSISENWADDLQSIAALKVLKESNIGSRRITTGLISNGLLKDEDYIEVLRVGSFSARDLQEARISASDAPYESLVAQRRATGPRPRLEALIWRMRRRRADAALRRAKVDVRVVTTTGRVKA